MQRKPIARSQTPQQPTAAERWLRALLTRGDRTSSARPGAALPAAEREQRPSPAA